MATEFFIQLVLILFSARFLGELVARFKIPSVIGELFAGVLLGPSLLNLVQPTDTIKLLAEIGIVLLLFEVGLDTALSRLVKTGLSAFYSAFAGVVSPFILGYGVSYYILQLPLLPSLFIGSTLTATSIGITLRVLSDLKQQTSRESQIVLGAAIIDDIIGIVLLSVLYEFSVSGVVDVFNAGKILLFILVFLILAPILTKIISSIIKYYDDVSEIPGLLPTTIVSLLLFFAWLAHAFGAPELLGGFAAGIALSSSFILPLPKLLQTDAKFSHRVETQMKPIIHLFTPIFFVNIGLSLNLQDVAWGSTFVWIAAFSLLFVAVIGKLLAGFILVKETRFIQWAVGIAMIPRGEVGLIFAEVGKDNGVLTHEIYTTLIIVIALTTLLSPFALRIFYKNKISEIKDEGTEHAG